MDKVFKREFRFNDPCQPCKEGIGCDECDHVPKSFWNSYPLESMTPAQRKHFKEIMRVEVRTGRLHTFGNVVSVRSSTSL